MEKRKFILAGKIFMFEQKNHCCHSPECFVQFTRKSFMFLCSFLLKLQVLHGYQDNIHDKCDVEEPHQPNAWNQKS